MSKGLSDGGLEYDPNHPSIIEELLQVRKLKLINKALSINSKSMSGPIFKM